MKLKILIVLTSLFLLPQAKASHLLGGYIHSEWVAGNQYNITVYLFADSRSDVLPGQGVLNFGDGTSLQAPFNTDVQEISEGFNLVSLSVLHTYGGNGQYKVSYSEDFYNNGIINFQNANSIPLYISALLTISPVYTNNSSPILQLLNIQKGLKGKTQRINPVASDADNDSLSYHLIVPDQNSASKISNYRYPNDSLFYINYNTGNQDKNAQPEYSISPVTGEIVWDAPGLLGEYAIAYSIVQWRNIGGNWTNIGENQVVLIDKIFDADKEITISNHELICYDDAGEINQQFLIDKIGSSNYTLSVFTDLPGAILNNQVAMSTGILEFPINDSFTLDLTVPDSLELIPYRPYRVILSIATPNETVTSSWAFAIGCQELPDNITPEPIVIDEENACKSLVVYPNPSNQQFINICIPNISESNRILRITDLKGRKLLEQVFSQTSSMLTVDIGALKTGLYIVQIGEMTAKFVVE